MTLRLVASSLFPLTTGPVLRMTSKHDDTGREVTPTVHWRAEVPRRRRGLGPCSSV